MPASNLPVTGTFGATGASASFQTAEGFNISLSGTWVATVSLQRSFDNGVSFNNITDGTFTANTEKRVDDPAGSVRYRWNCSAFTSGSVVYRISA